MAWPVHGSKIVEADEFNKTLQGLPWVLASRGGGIEFRRPSEILILRLGNSLTRILGQTAKRTATRFLQRS